MRLSRRHVLASGLALTAGPVRALDPGRASGRYVDERLTLAPMRAVALLQDNAEGLLERPSQLRVLVSETIVEVAALYGLAFPPVRALARRGAVRGLLLEFDPVDRTALRMTVLAKPEDPQAFLATVSLSNSDTLWRRLEVAPTRVVGELASRDGLTLEFSAPIFTDPVEADLKGAAVRASEPVKVLVARAEALGRGDLAAARALSTKDAAENFAALPPDVLRMVRDEAPTMLRDFMAAQRVVIRRATAAVQVKEGWASLVRVGETWKVGE